MPLLPSLNSLCVLTVQLGWDYKISAIYIIAIYCMFLPDLQSDTEGEDSSPSTYSDLNRFPEHFLSAIGYQNR